jgi:thermitase
MLNMFMEEDTANFQKPWWKTINAKSVTLVVFIILFLLLFIKYLATPPQNNQQKGNEVTQAPSYIPTTPKTKNRAAGQIVVKFKENISDAVISGRLKVFNAKIKSKIPGIRATVVEVPVGQEDAVMTALSKDPIVKYAEPDYIQRVNFVPNDTYFKNQWGLVNTGQTIKNKTGTANVDIHVQTAWDVSRGAGIKVAVLDTGLDMTHPDLASKVIAQKIFTTSSIDDKFGHGTHVAGIIAAKTNNGQGVAGVCPDCQLMIGKIMGDDGTGLSSSISTGITWAADNGAKVINLSEGGPDRASLQEDAIKYAWSKGVVLVAASGNSSSTKSFYPAALPNVISVAATDNTDKKAYFSNYGTWVNIAAPGENIYSTVPTHAYAMQSQSPLALTYEYISGTSMAAPMVSGIAALVWASPQGTSATNVARRILDTADKITGTGRYWESGRVNAAKAVGVAVSPSVLPSAAPSSSPSLVPSSNPAPTNLTPTFTCLGSPLGSVCPTISSGQAAPSLTLGPTTPTTSGEPVNAPSTEPNIDPCSTEVVQVQHNREHHKKHKGGGSGGNSGGLLESLLQFLQKLLELLKQLLGGTAPTEPVTPVDPNNPSPCPSLSPTQDISPEPTQ